MATSEHLLAILPFPEPVDWVARLRQKHPALKITWVHQSYGITTWDAKNQVDPDLYKDATILTTLSAFPKPEQAPNLKLIQLLPAGVDHLLHESIFQSDAQVATTSGIHAPQIAEWVVLQILYFSHHARYLADRQLEGRWASHDEIKASQGPVRDMTTARVGILGYGSIGRQVARVCHSMGSEILAFTASPRPTPESRRDDGFCLSGTGDQEGRLPVEWFHGLDRQSVRNFLQQDLDVVVICLPLTKQSKHLIGAEELAMLGGRALLINVARGQIVDQEALIASLKRPASEGGLRGAALDVTDPEPLPEDNELWKLPKVVVHPHVSGLTDKHQERYLAVLEENLGRMERGQPLLNLVSKKRGY